MTLETWLALNKRPDESREEAIERYTNKSIYGGDGGHYKNEPAYGSRTTINPNTYKRPKF